MIRVVGAANRWRHRAAIEAHHRIRHEIFVGERGWHELARPDGREIDAFDGPDAIYVLAMAGAEVTGGFRLCPTTAPHMLSEVFPHLVTNGPLPRGDHVLEWTRLFVARDHRSGRTYFELLAALQSLCIHAGIREVTGVIESWWLPRFHEAGFAVRPLGLPQMVAGQPTLAIAIAIDRAALARVRELGHLRPPPPLASPPLAASGGEGASRFMTDTQPAPQPGRPGS
ncbi:acyl-homoserine-lactone synthase [Tistrella mobilis]|uniref:acyl-homoserine-lactone synthase n=1 Tax=Tistrella mobilis TaxID=171437 RepID=UPI003556CD97